MPPLELEMFTEMVKYFQTDVENITRYINQTILIRKGFNPATQYSQIAKCNESIEYLKQRKNFALNCVSFLKKKVNELRKEAKTN